MKVEHIYVLLTDTGTTFTNLIKAFTAAPYNHASIAMDMELRELYSFGRKCPNNPWSAGFIEEDMYEGTYRFFPETRCVLLRLSVTMCQKEAIGEAIKSFQRQKEIYRYNLLGLLGVLLQVEIAPQNSYFCSQFVAELLQSGRCPLWSLPPALVTPNDFLKHSAFELVYEGYLYDYPLLDRNKVKSIGRSGATSPLKRKLQLNGITFPVGSLGKRLTKHVMSSGNS